jgi:hypothetical protein
LELIRVSALRVASPGFNKARKNVAKLFVNPLESLGYGNNPGEGPQEVDEESGGSTYEMFIGGGQEGSQEATTSLGLGLVATGPPRKYGGGKVVSGYHPLANLFGEESGQSGSKFDSKDEDGKSRQKSGESTDKGAQGGKGTLKLGFGGLNNGLNPSDSIVHIVCGRIELIDNGGIRQNGIESFAVFKRVLKGGAFKISDNESHESESEGDGSEVTELSLSGRRSHIKSLVGFLRRAKATSDSKKKTGHRVTSLRENNESDVTMGLVVKEGKDLRAARAKGTGFAKGIEPFGKMSEITGYVAIILEIDEEPEFINLAMGQGGELPAQFAF